MVKIRWKLLKLWLFLYEYRNRTSSNVVYLKTHFALEAVKAEQNCAIITPFIM